MYNIGDIVRFRFSHNIVGIVIGYGEGERFAHYLGFEPKEIVVLILREDNTLIPIKLTNPDFEKVGEFDLTELKQVIQQAKED